MFNLFIAFVNNTEINTMSTTTGLETLKKGKLITAYALARSNEMEKKTETEIKEMCSK